MGNGDGQIIEVPATCLRDLDCVPGSWFWTHPSLGHYRQKRGELADEHLCQIKNKHMGPILWYSE